MARAMEGRATRGCLSEVVEANVAVRWVKGYVATAEHCRITFGWQHNAVNPNQ